MAIFFLILISIINYSCSYENEKTLSEEKAQSVKYIPENQLGWYRGEIPSYVMSVGKIKMEKSLIYISINEGITTVLHSQKGSSFIGSGAMKINVGGTEKSGLLIADPEDKSGTSSHYEVGYKRTDRNNYRYTLRGFTGQPDIELVKVKSEVSVDSFLEDLSKTILNK